jgi:type III secretion system TyeA family effector delivery regulator
VRFGVARAMSSDLSGGGGGGQDDGLREKLEQVAERLENEHGPEIAAGNNISPVLNEFVSTRPDDAGDVREGYRRAVFDYKTPADAYRFIATNLAKFTGEGATSGPVSTADGENFEQRLGVALDFLANALAADLAATKPSGEPTHLREVVDGLQQVRFLGNAHESCRGLLTKFHNSTRESVPVAPFRLMTAMLDAAKGERVSENEFTRLAMDFNVPPLEPSINFMTQFRDIVRNLPPRAYEKPEARERVLDAMQKAIDQFIDEEEVALG